MELKVQLTDEQLLNISKDLKAALPAILEANINSIVAAMLTPEGESNERSAYANTLIGKMDSWDARNKAEKYLTLRQAVVLKISECLRERVIEDAELKQIISDLAEWYKANRTEIVAQSFGAFLDRTMQHLGGVAQENSNRLLHLTSMLQSKGIIPQ